MKHMISKNKLIIYLLILGLISISSISLVSATMEIYAFGIEDFDDSYIKGSSSTTCPSSNSESMKNSYWIDETTSDNQYSADSLATDYDSSYDDTHHDSDKMTDFNNYKEMKDWLSDDWKNDKYLSKSYKESKEYKEIQNRFSVDGVNEKDLIADSTHKIYHKPTCK